jgi:hypothetical protein
MFYYCYFSFFTKCVGQKNKDSIKSRVSEAFNEQHKEWVSFQQTLQVSGRDTGQTLTVKASAMTGGKTRGGKAVRKKREKELAPERARREQEKLMEAVSLFVLFIYSCLVGCLFVLTN